MRHTLYGCLCAILATVSVSAPFAHTHDPGKAEEHLAREHFSILHAHIVLPNEDPALAEVGDSARRVDWFRFELEEPVALTPPAASALPAVWLYPSGWAAVETAAPLPEESPPRAVPPRGPPSLFV